MSFIFPLSYAFTCPSADGSLQRENIDTMDNMESMRMSYELLKTITADFSKDRLLGSGTFGVVYKV